jgi:hypothetical protein
VATTESVMVPLRIVYKIEKNILIIIGEAFLGRESLPLPQKIRSVAAPESVMVPLRIVCKIEKNIFNYHWRGI